MELTKRKEELMAYLELNTNDNTTGFALRNFLRESGGASNYDVPYIESKNSTEEEGSSAESEEGDVDDVIMDEIKDHEDGRDDEDFIMLVPPKGKKKNEKKPIRTTPTKQSNSKKRKCEFCGTVETPMWRRGPAGKGTLCNACGVKWSLKFRKRVGKKANSTKSERGKEEPREHRQSTRKKIPAKKSDLSLGGLETSDLSKHEDDREHTGLCCNHSLRRKREDNSIDSERAGKKMAYLSDCDSDTGNLGLGRLLNVVEVQLVEEEQIDKVKMELQNLRSQLQATRQRSSQQVERTKSEVMQEIADLRKEFHTIFRNDYATQQAAQLLQNFANTFNNRIREITAPNGMNKTLEELQIELGSLGAQFDETVGELKTKAANDYLHVEKLLQSKEEKIRKGLAASMKEDSSDHDLEDISKRLDSIDDSLETGP